MSKLKQGTPLELTVGANDSFEMQILNGGEVVDITGYTITLYVARTPESEVLLTKSTADAEEAVLTTPAEGKFRVYFIPADTVETLPVGTLYYDVWMTTDDARELPTMLPTMLTVRVGVGRS